MIEPPKPTNKGWGALKADMAKKAEEKLKSHSLTAEKFADMTRRLTAQPKHKKKQTQESEEKTFDERYKERMKMIRKGKGEEGDPGGASKGDHLLVVENLDKLCYCYTVGQGSNDPHPRGRWCPGQPVFAPGNRPITTQASPDGLFVMRNRAAELGGTMRMGASTRNF